MRYFWLVVMGYWGSANVLGAERQFSVNKCAALEAERVAIQAKMRAGYDVSEYNFLNGRELKLFQLQARHCVHPIPDEQAAAAYLAPHKTQRQQQSQIRDDFPLMQANNAVFAGAMAKAWDNFYQMPVQCRVHQQSAEDFVFCAEDKWRQRQAFLQQWQPQGAELAEPAQSALEKTRTKQSQQARNSSVFPTTAADADRPSYLSERNAKLNQVSSPQSMPKQADLPAEFKPQSNAYREPVMTPLQMNNSAQLQQFSGLGLGALVMFLWMSWWLWRR